MGKFILMPKLDMSMESGIIVDWLVKENDYIQKGDYIVEVETGKVSIQVDNTTAEGYVRGIYAQIGDSVDVQTPIMYVGELGEEPPENISSFENEQPQQTAPLTQTKGTNENKFDFDIAIIGAGPAGYTHAIIEGKKGKKVILFEGTKLGGTCLNKGCIPTKALIKSAQVIQTIKKSPMLGIEIENFKFSKKQILKRQNEVIKTLHDGVLNLLKEANVQVISGLAEVKAENTLKVKKSTYTAEKIVIATGSIYDNYLIRSDDSVKIVNSDDIIDLKVFPKDLAIYGNNVMSIEFAYIFNQFGANTTLIIEDDYLLNNTDKDFHKLVTKLVKQSGVEVITQDKPHKIENSEILLKSGRSIKSDLLLVVNKRKAVIPCTYKELAKTSNNFIAIDETMLTSIPNIYAIGDCTGKHLTAPSAYAQGETLSKHFNSEIAKLDYSKIPVSLFAYPEAAWIGMSEEEAKARNIPIKVSKTRYSTLGKALTEGETDGLIKVIADKRWDEILGVFIVGANATDIIAQASIAMSSELCANDIARSVFAHPTLSEGFMSACENLNE